MNECMNRYNDGQVYRWNNKSLVIILIHNDNSNNIFIAVLYSVVMKEEVSDHNKRYNKKTYSSNDIIIIYTI